MKRGSSRRHTGPNAEVRAYIAKLPPKSRRAVTTMRSAIRSAAPRAVEHFSYGVPAFRLDDRPLVWYAGFKEHASLYPMTARIRKKHAVALEGYKTATGTIRFPLDKPIPVALVRKLVKARAAESRRDRRA